MFVPLYALASIPTTITYEAPQPSKSLEEMVGELRPTPSEPESLYELATRIAGEYGVPTSTLFNLIGSESQWNPKAYNAKTGDRGIVQISEIWNPDVTDECAFDAECSLRWAVERLARGEHWRWAVCSCVQYMKARGAPIPNGFDANEILPNTPEPVVGALVLIDYENIGHVAMITEVGSTTISITESNYERCKITSRTIDRSDAKIRGYWMAG